MTNPILHPSWCVVDEPDAYCFAGVHKSNEQLIVDDRNNHLTVRMMQPLDMAEEPYLVLSGVSEREPVTAMLSYAAAEELVEALCGLLSTSSPLRTVTR